MLERITPEQAKRMMDEEGAWLIDVRETDEFLSRRIPGAFSQPLSVLPLLPADSDLDKPAIFFCNSGNRTAGAEKLLAGRGHTRAYVIDGGLEAWERAKLPIESYQGVLPLSRQVHIAAGSIIALFLLIGQNIPFFRIFVLFTGFGLLASGLTGACGMAILLKKMPWNKK